MFGCSLRYRVDSEGWFRIFRLFAYLLNEITFAMDGYWKKWYLEIGQNRKIKIRNKNWRIMFRMSKFYFEVLIILNLDIWDMLKDCLHNKYHHMQCYEVYSLQHCITFQIKDWIGQIKKVDLISKKVIKNWKALKIQIIKVVVQ